MLVIPIGGGSACWNFSTRGCSPSTRHRELIEGGRAQVLSSGQAESVPWEYIGCRRRKHSLRMTSTVLQLQRFGWVEPMPESFSLWKVEGSAAGMRKEQRQHYDPGAQDQPAAVGSASTTVASPQRRIRSPASSSNNIR